MAELTKEEQQQLDALTAGTESSNDKYNWDEEFQREILGLLLNDRHFVVTSMALIKPNYFTNDCHKRISSIIFSHFEKYNVIPSRVQIIQELKEKISENDSEVRIYNLAELNTVYEFYVPGAESRDYYRDKISNFAKTTELKLAFHNCLQEIKKAPEDEETWSKIHTMLRNALTIEHNFDFGLEYFQTVQERYARRELQQVTGDVFTTGFESIDQALKAGGLLRGEMGSWMGGSGVGKSLALVACAIANMNRGKRVLYVSLEIDSDAVGDRFDAQLVNPYGVEDGIAISDLLKNKFEVFKALENYVEDYDDKRLLVIKQFPAGQMDLPMFRAYFQQCALRNFRPDLIILDYVGEMKDYPNMPTYESRYRIVRDLRGFATEEKVCILTAMQPNRAAKGVIKAFDVMDEEQLSDSYDQIKPLDALWTINQHLDEKDAGLARIFVAKHREGKTKFIFHVEYNPYSLKISQITKEKYDARLKEFRLKKEVKVVDKTKKGFSKGSMVEDHE